MNFYFAKWSVSSLDKGVWGKAGQVMVKAESADAASGACEKWVCDQYGYDNTVTVDTAVTIGYE